MKYLPPIDITAPGIATAVYEGYLRLQPGQWLRCNGALSRFLGASRHVIYALHGANATNQSAISQMRARFKINNP